jgi:pimeloyl-ACP methyl ester carboxylesterase
LTFTVPTPDGRDLEVLTAGDGERVLVFHNGTPTAAERFAALESAAETLGLRIVAWSRPGYAGSSPMPGRRVASAVTDGRAVLTAVDAGDADYVVLGWSGGGPHALAHAAFDPHCRAAATIGGAAPSDLMGDAWLDGTGPENLAEFGAAQTGSDVLQAWLEEASAPLRELDADGVAAGLGGLVDEVDRAVVTGTYAEDVAAWMRAAVSTGVAGWRDDDLAFLQPWGFELGAMEVPVTVWQGGHDLMVPPAHGSTLAAAIPTARLRLDPAEGHLSWVDRLDEILADLAEAGFGA